MNPSNDFNDWFGTYRARVPLAAFKSLAADLRHRILAKRVLYRQANTRIAIDLANGLPRLGRRKLKLTPTELVEHTKARKDRAQSQQALRILVPLYRRVIAATQQWTPGKDAPHSALEAAVWLLPLTTPLNKRRYVLTNVPDSMLKWTYGENVEQTLAAELAREHPLVFFRPVVEVLVPPATSSIDQLALFQKIVKAVVLTPEEQSLLAGALRVSAAG